MADIGNTIQNQSDGCQHHGAVQRFFRGSEITVYDKNMIPAGLSEMDFELALKNTQIMSGLLNEGILVIGAKNGITLIGAVVGNVPEMPPVVLEATCSDAF